MIDFRGTIYIFTNNIKLISMDSINKYANKYQHFYEE